MNGQTVTIDAKRVLQSEVVLLMSWCCLHRLNRAHNLHLIG